MNVERMTQRVQEALNAAYTRALTEHNTQTTPEHLLAAILDQTAASPRPSFEKAGADPQTRRASRSTRRSRRCRATRGPNADRRR